MPIGSKLASLFCIPKILKNESNSQLISNDKVEDFQQEILDDYARLCAIHNRCKGIEKKFYENRGDFFLFGSNAEFKLLKSK